jgi:hypothetical protein
VRKKGEAEATRRGMKSGDVVCTVPLKPRAANELQQFAFLANPCSTYSVFTYAITSLI